MAIDQEIARLNFEVERGLKLYKTTTLLQDNSILNYDGDPNLAIKAASKGQALLHTSPLGTMFIQQSGILWSKIESGFGAKWEILGASAGDPAVSTNAFSEYVLAGISEDESFHFEDYSIFCTADGEAILFETTLEVDETAFSAMDGTNIFFLEGDDPLILDDLFLNTSLDMSTTDNIAGVFDNKLSRQADVFLADFLADSNNQNALRINRTVTNMLGINRRDMLIRTGTSEYLVVARNTWLYKQDDMTTGFYIENIGSFNWTVNDPCYVVLENDTVVPLIAPAGKYRFSPDGVTDGGYAKWTVTDLISGAFLEIDTTP